MKKERVEGALQFTKTPTLLYYSVNTRTAAFFSTLRSNREGQRDFCYLFSRGPVCCAGQEASTTKWHYGSLCQQF